VRANSERCDCGACGITHHAVVQATIHIFRNADVVAFEMLKPETQQVATVGLERPMRFACPRKMNLVRWQRRRFFIDRRKRMSRLSVLS
jgi:hypothetical protein